MTSRRCLDHIKKQPKTCIPQFAWDVTFKVNDMRYPVIITVIEDANYTILPTFFTIIRSESEETSNFDEIYYVNLC